MLRIEQAQASDLGTVLSVLDEAAQWLSERGIEQWPARFSGDATWRIDRIRDYLEAGQTYLMREDEHVAACMTLTPDADPDYAHAWPDGPQAGGYVHRMATRNVYRGRDLGNLMLDWAGHQVAGWPRPWLRLDCHRHNRDLQVYYERRGFQRVATVESPDPTVPGRIRGSGALYQRPARLLDHHVAPSHLLQQLLTT